MFRCIGKLFAIALLSCLAHARQVDAQGLPSRVPVNNAPSTTRSAAPTSARSPVASAPRTASPYTSRYAPVRRYNGIDAGQEAYLIHENQRRGLVTAQMALNDDMQMLRGLPPRYFDYFPANPFDAWPSGSLANDLTAGNVGMVDAYGMPYYLSPPLSAGVPAVQSIPDASGVEIPNPRAAAGNLVAPAPNPPRSANANGDGVAAGGNRPLVDRQGRPLRPEQLPAPAEVRDQLQGNTAREF